MPRPLPSLIREAEVGTTEYLRLRRESHGPGQPDDPYVPRDSDPRWHEARLWNGERRYVPHSGLSNDWVRHAYNPLDALDD
jgi:hypothetical protein